MEPNMARFCNNNPENTITVDPIQGGDEGLKEMSPSELKFMQDVTLHQIQQADLDTRLVLGRIWQRLEGELCRRKAEIAELEQMYFG
jgi:hypothetical protein